LSEEQTPQVIVFSGKVSEEEAQKDIVRAALDYRAPNSEAVV
jgi:hypothetical protein